MSFETSGLEFTVEPKTNDFVLPIEKAPKRAARAGRRLNVMIATNKIAKSTKRRNTKDKEQPVPASTMPANTGACVRFFGCFVLSCFRDSLCSGRVRQRDLAALGPALIAKMVLPSLGGTPAVWITCQLFFQAFLLAGYAYTHFSIRWLGVRRQAWLHAALVLLPFAVLPLSLRDAVPPTDGNPVGWLLLLLAVSVGLPFFALAATAPLLQKWFAVSGHPASQNPFFLYAASNLGSLLALIAYPVVVEPYIRLSAMDSLLSQVNLWALGYGLFCLLLFACLAISATARQHSEACTPHLAKQTSLHHEKQAAVGRAGGCPLELDVGDYHLHHAGYCRHSTSVGHPAGSVLIELRHRFRALAGVVPCRHRPGDAVSGFGRVFLQNRGSIPECWRGYCSTFSHSLPWP